MMEPMGAPLEARNTLERQHSRGCVPECESKIRLQELRGIEQPEVRKSSYLWPPRFNPSFAVDHWSLDGHGIKPGRELRDLGREKEGSRRFPSSSRMLHLNLDQ